MDSIWILFGNLYYVKSYLYNYRMYPVVQGLPKTYDYICLTIVNIEPMFLEMCNDVDV